MVTSLVKRPLFDNDTQTIEIIHTRLRRGYENKNERAQKFDYRSVCRQKRFLRNVLTHLFRLESIPTSWRCVAWQPWHVTSWSRGCRSASEVGQQTALVLRGRNNGQKPIICLSRANIKTGLEKKRVNYGHCLPQVKLYGNVGSMLM